MNRETAAAVHSLEMKSTDRDALAGMRSTSKKILECIHMAKNLTSSLDQARESICPSSSGGAISFPQGTRHPTDVHGHQVADSHLSIVLQQLKDQLTGNIDPHRAKILADQVSTLSKLVTVLH